MELLKTETLYETLAAKAYEIEKNQRRVQSKPGILGVGSAFPKQNYSQQEIAELFEISNPVVKKFLKSPHISKRHLYLSVDAEKNVLLEETQQDLNQKFHNGVRDIGTQAGREALSSAHIQPADVDILIAVTSSGFAVPGLSSILARELDLRADLHRLDIVGMGCNAGMSALYSATKMLEGQSQKTALVVCCEVNSAIYTKDETIRTGIVNSLFGDGAAALVLKSGDISSTLPKGASAPSFEKAAHPIESIKLLDFETVTLSEEAGAMRFDWDNIQQRWSFFLSKDIPFVIGDNMNKPVQNLLDRHGLTQDEIAHWVLHTGGEAVIRGAQKSLSLSDEQVRHTRSVLRDYGNISSGSFIVSLQRLLQEGRVQSNDLIILIAMGPGSTIEVGLAKAL